MNVPPVPVIATQRCVLTLLVPQRAALLVDYRRRNQTHLAPWEPSLGTAQTLEQSCRGAAERSVQGFADGTSVHFLALEPESQTMVAGCNFTNVVRGSFLACHLGYSVDQSWQGKGLMSEVLRAGMAYMFGTVGLHRIMANHMPANQRSEKLLRTLGFEREGYARAYLQIAGKWEDMVLNALVNPAP